MNRRWALAGVMVIGTVTGGLAAEKPRVPPGRDPGGVAVGIVGAGVDYVVPEIAVRLARDGEGEIIGFDLIDGDRRPYAATGPLPDPGARAALILVRQASASRLVVFRADVAGQSSLGRAVAMTALSPARIVLLDGKAGATLKRDGLGAVADRLADRLVVVGLEGAGDGFADEAGDGNVLTVRGCERVGADCVLNGGDGPMADVAVPMEPAGGETSGDAAARVAALAARVAGLEPGLDGAKLKARITAFARPMPGAGLGVRHGWIEEPARAEIAPK